MNFVGIDGCKAGWFYVVIDENCNWEIKVIASISEITDVISSSELVLIDIPIGLRTNGQKERLCDIDARRMLKPKRGSSVFPVPSRASLKAKSYVEACEINKKVSGRSLSKQSWNILEKINQVDSFLIQTESAREKFREMHPEICFWALNKHQCMQNNKKTEAGFQERLSLLSGFFEDAENIVKAAIKSFSRRDVAKDDILDAFVGAVTAGFYQSLATLPVNPERDEMNFPMEVVYPDIVTEDGVKPSWIDNVDGSQRNEDTAIILTPVGKIALYAQNDVLVRVDWVMENAPEKQPETEMLKSILIQLQHYWRKSGFSFNLPNLGQGTEFQMRVWQSLCNIPSGQTRTYGELAKTLKTSARAVGNACRRNPLPLFVPCHRVVSATGIGGYAGQTKGFKLNIKRRLLAHELGLENERTETDRFIS